MTPAELQETKKGGGRIMEYLYEIAKNGTSINKVKIAKECPKTYFLDTVVDKRVYKIEDNNELIGYNTYHWYFKDEETAKKWINSLKAKRDTTLSVANQKVIECLISVQKFVSDNAVYIEEEQFAREINEFIDQKIGELKGK